MNIFIHIYIRSYSDKLYKSALHCTSCWCIPYLAHSTPFVVKTIREQQSCEEPGWGTLVWSGCCEALVEVEICCLIPIRQPLASAGFSWNNNIHNWTFFFKCAAQHSLTFKHAPPLPPALFICWFGLKVHVFCKGSRNELRSVVLLAFISEINVDQRAAGWIDVDGRQDKIRHTQPDGSSSSQRHPCIQPRLHSPPAFSLRGSLPLLFDSRTRSSRAAVILPVSSLLACVRQRSAQEVLVVRRLLCSWRRGRHLSSSHLWRLDPGWLFTAWLSGE